MNFSTNAVEKHMSMAKKKRSSREEEEEEHCGRGFWLQRRELQRKRREKLKHVFWVLIGMVVYVECRLFLCVCRHPFIT